LDDTNHKAWQQGEVNNTELHPLTAAGIAARSSSKIVRRAQHTCRVELSATTSLVTSANKAPASAHTGTNVRCNATHITDIQVKLHPLDRRPAQHVAGLMITVRFGETQSIQSSNSAQRRHQSRERGNAGPPHPRHTGTHSKYSASRHRPSARGQCRLSHLQATHLAAFSTCACGEFPRRL
jgi:hypothetical protein